MESLDLEKWLPMLPMEGPPLPRFFNIYWPWQKGGFSLRIENAPAGAILWNANFAENTFNFDPMADSGWLKVDEVWEYPSDPLGCNTLRIWAHDAANNILFDERNLGPIESGRNYSFDCSTKILRSV